MCVIFDDMHNRQISKSVQSESVLCGRKVQCCQSAVVSIESSDCCNVYACETMKLKHMCYFGNKTLYLDNFGTHNGSVNFL